MAIADDDDPIEQSLKHGVDTALGGVKKGLAGAKKALETPAAAELEGLIEGTDLPELSDGDALSGLARRLDRDADLMRNLALRETTRAGWSDRIAQTVAILAAALDVGLGVVAVLGAMVGGEHAAGRAMLIGTASGALLAGALLVWIVSRSGARRATESAHDALERANQTELRLERVALLLALREANPKAYAQALAPLTSDTKPTRSRKRPEDEPEGR